MRTSADGKRAQFAPCSVLAPNRYFNSFREVVNSFREVEIPHHLFCFIISPLIDFFHSFQNEPLGLPERYIAALIRPMLEGLAYMHSQGVAWSDVRGKNIFVQRDGQVLLNCITLRSVLKEKTRHAVGSLIDSNSHYQRLSALPRT